MKQVFSEDMSEDVKKQAVNEAVIFQSIDSPYLCKLKDFFTEGESLFYVMHNYENGDLQTYIDKQSQGNFNIPETQIWNMLIQLLLGLQYLHKNKIMHRDIKASNIFMDQNNRVRIGDLGVARQMDHTFQLASTLVGTPYNLSPEICLGDDYSYKTDVWSLGIVLYQLCTLTLPFQANTQIILSIKIVNYNFKPI